MSVNLYQYQPLSISYP